MSLTFWLFVSAACFSGGFWLGCDSRDGYWTGKASSVTRACARGKLYRVTEEP